MTAGEFASALPVRAVPSASLLLVRERRCGGLETLITKRPKTMKFAPGALVFPGGKGEPSDNKLCYWQQYVRDSKSFSSLKISVLRELFEEVGVLYQEQPRPIFNGARDFRAALKGGGRLRDDQLTPIARWITPTAMPRRFDTTFFVAPWMTGLSVRKDGKEAIDAFWARPKDLLAKHARTEVEMMLPTVMLLKNLAK